MNYFTIRWVNDYCKNPKFKNSFFAVVFRNLPPDINDNEIAKIIEEKYPDI